MEIRIDKIRLPKALMRKVMDEAGIESLARSIRKLGIICPIVVRKEGKEYELVSGYRRLMAAEMCSMVNVPVIVRKDDDGQAEAVKMAENREREDVNAIDEGEYMVEVMKANGWNQKELARELGVSEAMVSQRVATAGWEKGTKDKVRRGVIKFSVARELEQVKDEVEKKRLIMIAVESGVTPHVAATWRREVNRALESEQVEAELERARTITHQPQKVYVACQTCEGAIEVEKVVFLRICEECHKVIKKVV